MRQTNFSIIYIFTFILFSIPSIGQMTIVGSWKPIFVILKPQMSWDKEIKIDLREPEKTKASLYQTALKKYSSKNSKISTKRAKQESDSIFKKFTEVNLVLSVDSSFKMTSNGFIIPIAVPGKHFGNTILGKWGQYDRDVILTIPFESEKYKIYYRIMYGSLDNFKVIETTADGLGQLKEILFYRE